MGIDPRIVHNIEEIRRYTERNDDLHQAHHFLYDKRNGNSERIDFVFMGMNPGEPKSLQQQFARENDMPIEETSVSDFIKQAGKVPSSTRYMNRCARMCGTPKFALTESLFWSSYNESTLHKRW